MLLAELQDLAFCPAQHHSYPSSMPCSVSAQPCVSPVYCHMPAGYHPAVPGAWTSMMHQAAHGQ